MPSYAQLQSEIYWIREYQPASLAALCDQLRQAFGVDAAALGSKGDNNHLYGYHRSRAWILNSVWSAYGPGDYSVQAATDRQGDANWLCAVDFTPGDADTMITVCRRLDAAVHAGLCPQLREWYGNVDGDQVVDGWDLLANQAATSDSSHLWHLHMSFLRGRAGDDHSNLFAILTGAAPAPVRPMEEDDVASVFFRAKDSKGNVSVYRAFDTWLGPAWEYCDAAKAGIWGAAVSDADPAKGFPVLASPNGMGTEISVLVKQYFEALAKIPGGGGGSGGLVTVSDASVAAIATKTADEVRADPERDGRDT